MSPDRVRRTALSVVVVASVLLSVLVGLSAPAGADEPDIGVTITGLSPSMLSSGATVTMTGIVSNDGDQTWTSAHAYLVVAHTPYVTRAQIEQAMSSDVAYAGERIIDVGYFDEIGNLAPHSTTGFSISVPWNLLGLSGAEGVYPVGVQIVATDSQGNRSSDSIGRATTFLPMAAAGRPAVPTGLVWTFAPDSADTDSATSYDDVLTSISEGGRRRAQLDLAIDTPATSRTLLIDPMLLQQVNNLATGQNLPSTVEPSEEDKAAATKFVDDLVELSKSTTTWLTPFGSPDLVALAATSGTTSGLLSSATTATTLSQDSFELPGRVVLPTGNYSVTSDVLDANRTSDQPFVLSAASLPGWEDRLGSVVNYETPSGPTQLIVEHSLPGTPGSMTAITIRQDLLAQATLASLSRSSDSTSRADALVFVDPGWVPADTVTADQLGLTSSISGITSPATGDTILQSTDALTYTGGFSAAAGPAPLSREVMDSAAQLASTNTVFADLVNPESALSLALNASTANAVSMYWRADPATDLSRIAARTSSLDTAMSNSIQVTGPTSVALSSAKGSFPLTISNDTEYPIEVGVTFTTSNPAIDLPDVAPMTVLPHERRTVDVAIDLGSQGATTVKAQLVTKNGDRVGQSSEFNVRSTQVALMVWIALGIAAAGVGLTMIRHFRHRRAATEHSGDDVVEDVQ